jgi:hypothetical protein
MFQVFIRTVTTVLMEPLAQLKESKMCDCGGDYGCTLWCEDRRQEEFEAKYGKVSRVETVYRYSEADSQRAEIDDLKEEIKKLKQEVLELRNKTK